MKRRHALGALAAGAASMALPALARSAQEPLRFAWWGGGGRHEATLKAVRLFEQRHPGTQIKAEYMGFNGYLERLTAQIAGRSEPDVMQINWAWLAMFSKRGTGFTDLEPLIGPAVREQLPADDIAMGRVAGKLNALSVGYTARVMLWNRGTFDKLKVPLPRTWDDLFTAGAAFRRTLGEGAFPLDGELYDMLLLAPVLGAAEARHGVHRARCAARGHGRGGGGGLGAHVPAPGLGSRGDAAAAAREPGRRGEAHRAAARLGERPLGRQLHVGFRDRIAREHAQGREPPGAR
jgi:oligogalacturonide transport system substrate-binding protein